MPTTSCATPSARCWWCGTEGGHPPACASTPDGAKRASSGSAISSRPARGRRTSSTSCWSTATRSRRRAAPAPRLDATLLHAILLHALLLHALLLRATLLGAPRPASRGLRPADVETIGRALAHRRLLDVVGRCAHQGRVVLEIADAQIAVVAQQRADRVGQVTMIDREPAARGFRLADPASPVLPRQQGIVVGDRHPVLGHLSIHLHVAVTRARALRLGVVRISSVSLS